MFDNLAVTFEFTTSLRLPDEENSAFHHIETQAEHDAFMERLLREHRSDIEQQLQEQFSGAPGIESEQRPAP